MSYLFRVKRSFRQSRVPTLTAGLPSRCRPSEACSARAATTGPERKTLHAAWFPPEIFSVCILGVAGFLMGLLEIATRTGRRQRLWGSLAALCTGVMALLAAAAFYCGQAAAIWFPPLLLAVIAVPLLACRL